MYLVFFERGGRAGGFCLAVEFGKGGVEDLLAPCEIVACVQFADAEQPQPEPPL